jgi:hypothetical protein
MRVAQLENESINNNIMYKHLRCKSESRDEFVLICMSLLHECGTCFYPFNNLCDSSLVSTPAFPDFYTLPYVQSMLNWQKV